MPRTLRILLIGILAGVLVLGSLGLWVVFGPNTPGYEGERSVKIPSGANFTTVTDSLAQNGILSSRLTFQLVGQLSGWRDQIKSGHYAFEAGTSNYTMLNVLRRGLQTPIQVVVPPGSQPGVVARTAARDMAFDSTAFRSALRDTALAAALDTDTTHLFGYMMPETYNFYWQTPAEEVVRRIKTQFDESYERHFQSSVDSLDLSKEELVTLASIIEWETGLPEEKPRIAGVYLNRLDIGMALQADPTVQYAVMQREGKKRRLYFRDYDIDHPYNTYNYRGLPPGPLTNPSLSSMQAVVEAEAHDYLYFVATEHGEHAFSKTLRDHARAANEYRRYMREQHQD